MSVQTVARRYASALADVVIARGEAREVQNELAEWERMMFSNAQLLEVFTFEPGCRLLGFLHPTHHSRFRDGLAFRSADHDHQ